MPTVGLDSGQWFDVADATKWHGSGGMLYLVGSTWALRDNASAMIGDPAKLIDERRAVKWLTSNGHDIPAELQPLAEQTRLRSVPVSAVLEVSS